MTLKSVVAGGALGLTALVMFAGCDSSSSGNAGTATATPTATASATPEPPPKPTRKEVLPLPDSETVANELLAASPDPGKSRVDGARPKLNLQGLARIVPAFDSVLYPPTNATKLKVQVVLEDDAFGYHEKLKTDGVVVTIATIGANGETIATAEADMDPSKAALLKVGQEVAVDVPAAVDHVSIKVSARKNGALDNTSLIFTYE